MTRKEELAYLAALIDGEGSVLFTRKKRNAHPAAQITICMTDVEVIDWLKNTFGGSTSSQGKTKGSFARKKRHYWGVANAQAINLLREMVPRLKIPRKRARAEFLVTEYPRCVKARGAGRYTSVELERRHDMKRRWDALFAA